MAAAGAVGTAGGRGRVFYARRPDATRGRGLVVPLPELDAAQHVDELHSGSLLSLPALSVHVSAAGWSLQLEREQQQQKKKSTKQQQRGAGGGWYVSPATVALKCLVLWIYWDAGYGKYTDPLGGWSYSADPLPALDTYARHTLVAQYLYALVGPSGLRIMTPVVVWVELLAAPVALLGAYLGSPALVYTAIALIVSLHVGIALTLRNAALLSFVACAAWCGFLPFDLGSRPNNSNKKAAAPRVVTWSSRSTTLLSLVLIGSMVAGSLWLETISNACDQSVKHIWSTLLHNRWNVFVGAETYVTWEIAPGQLQDGSIVDVWGRRDTVDWSLPGGGAPCTATARPGRWRSFPYLAGLQGEEGDALWRYLCNEWDRENKVDEANPGRKLIKYNFFMLQADVLPEMQFSATRKRLIQSYDCVPPEEAAVAEDVVEGNKEKEESIPRGELSESKHPDAPNKVESNEPEVPRESDVPTEEPEFIDPDRSEPVPGPDMPGDGNEEEETIPAGEPSETVQPDTPTEMESNEPEVPRESDVPTDEPEFVDPDRSEPVPDMQGDEL